MKKLINVLLYLWQLPQNIAGLIVVQFCKVIYTHYIYDCKVYVTEHNFGVCLGRYIIIGKNHSENTLLHEYGHSIQSKYTGWFYLLFIGLPSIVRNVYCRITKDWSNYYKGYPEQWADKLGEVKR